MMKINGNKYHIIKAAQPFLTIIAYVKPIEKEKNGAIANIVVIPQIIYFLFSDFPLLNWYASTEPSIAMDNAMIIANLYHPFLFI